MWISIYTHRETYTDIHTHTLCKKKCYVCDKHTVVSVLRNLHYIWKEKNKYMKSSVGMKWKLLSCVWLFATPWTIQSTEFWRLSPHFAFPSEFWNTGMGSLSLLQGIFPAQGSNPGLLCCRPILYPLSHQGSPSRRHQIEKYHKVVYIYFPNDWYC